MHITEEQCNIVDNFKMTWDCHDWKSLYLGSKQETIHAEQFNEIIQILLDDIAGLKGKIEPLKSENSRKSEVEAK